jgi:hypothetical protein
MSVPSHHQAEALDMFQVDGLRVWLEPTSVCRIQARPRDEDDTIGCIARDRLRRKLEVTLVGDGGLLATVGLIGG